MFALPRGLCRPELRGQRHSRLRNGCTRRISAFSACCLADRRRSGADGEGVGFAGEDHDHRKPRSLSRVETLGEADREAQSFGLLTPTGINSTTGIAGLTLGGGFGWISHKFGLTADN